MQGNYQLCVENSSKSPVQINWVFSTGSQAIDYADVVQKKHLKPVEVSAQRSLDMIEQLRKELGDLVVSEERLKEGN